MRKTVFGALDRRPQQILHAVAAMADRGNDRSSPERGETLQIELDAARLGRVGHIERQNQRRAQFDQLHGQIKIAFEVGGVDDVDHHIGLFV
ncbi:MAG: hypothetical protein BWZ10_03283 [candidate division BRC1 bacterium ADurb.BinA364]|nr:MAG: hypothetical protein BWZ10_03283 [candidate division BRC1 bacterium ADurb.BinA364]